MLQVKAALEDQYAGKAANDTVGALTALLKDSPRVNPRKGAPLEAFSSVPQARPLIFLPSNVLSHEAIAIVYHSPLRLHL